MDKKLKDFIDNVSSRFKGKIKDDDSKYFGFEGDLKADFNFDNEDEIEEDDDVVFSDGILLPNYHDENDISNKWRTEDS